MAFKDNISPLNFTIFSLGSWLVVELITRVARRNRLRTTPLKGPRTWNFVTGLAQQVLAADDQGALFEDWADKYGAVYQVPMAFGEQMVLLCDAKAIAHHYSKDTYTYQQPPSDKLFIDYFFGRGILWAEEDLHKRQRKALSAAFSNTAIRDVMPVFLDSAYLVKTAWDSMIENDNSGKTLIDVQEWMNHVSLDSIGRAGFSHDFGSLKRNRGAVTKAFDAFAEIKPDIWMMLVAIFSTKVPFIYNIPTKETTLFRGIHVTVAGIADHLLEGSRIEKEAGVNVDKSVVGILLGAQSSESMSRDEIIAQMNLFMLAGYETTSIALTWALIELSRNPSEQNKLRTELALYSTEDPTWDQLMHHLPYLDAITCETLRLHPPVSETTREAAEDDIIPLGAPIRTSTGETVDQVMIAKGTIIRIPIRCVNRSTAIWGPDAKEFIPARWLDDRILLTKAADVQGYRHLLTFIDGQRSCLGRVFALTEFKAVLSVLIRNYIFELPHGPDTVIETHRSMLDRPAIGGKDKATLPLVVRRVDSA